MIDTINTFYKAFKALDAEKMVSCYHENIKFEDPAFGMLDGESACNMWRMLCESQKNKGFQLEFSQVHYDGVHGHAHWEATYTFSKTGRKVHNVINAQFEFKEDKIIKHTDDFDLHRWAKQAMGFKGWFLGGTKFFKDALQKQTNQLLSTYETKIKKAT